MPKATNATVVASMEPLSSPNGIYACADDGIGGFTIGGWRGKGSLPHADMDQEDGVLLVRTYVHNDDDDC